MKPVIALVGHFNVGKSTLFNRLTHTFDALVSDIPGSTRDRKYGFMQLSGIEFIIVDTGGINDIKSGVESCITSQSLIAAKEADIILFIVDAITGLINDDQKIAKYLHSYKKLTFVVVNKINGLDINSTIFDFYSLGFNNICVIDAYNGYGISNLLKKIFSSWNNYSNYITNKIYVSSTDDKKINYLVKTKKSQLIDLPIKLAIVGRPNVGKSTLINSILGENRVIVHNTPGTTLDSIYMSIKYLDYNYILIDTAGVRKRSNINQTIEKNSILRTLKAIDYSNVVILMIDAHEDITQQDYYLLNFIIYKGRSLVIVINKWDSLSIKIRHEIKEKIKLRLRFVNFARVHFISALYNIGLEDLFKSINETYNYSTKYINTSLLTNIMHAAAKNCKPPLAQGRYSIKMKYAHIGSYNPITVVIHGNRIKYLPDNYKRYLATFFRKSMNIIGSLIYIQLKEGENPYIKNHNILTKQQQRKRKRTIKYVKNMH
ncbi:ribosome biogenesis GTPase Der [Candidatus Pantoea edessiphila]|uniref:GTPase Der n=1 Tax=Candidatus Pantoea edessiphila TaxID=2044610 RepID=A0A2P5T2V6_9GAMM|nr:ribosome biogenesis GTPase Der [Candidatus Pantoea edessiphila]PPI88921.1 ribosome biogenesis GTPase Der [Candidatus Pantoea edessiphila]